MKRPAVLDIETDPFLYNRIPLPFACGFYDGENYFQTWGDSCIAEIVDYLMAYKEPCEIFAHNGGKFDWHYFAYTLSEPVNFIKNRMLRAQLGHHTVRDSYAIIPAPLRDYKKDDTDYATFEYSERNKHKESISKYLRHDCEYLYDLVKNFIDRFGNKLTIASTAMQELRKFYDVKHESPEFDEEFRPYYFGGRVQCFARGIVKGNWKCYDINSSYPNAMRNFPHPAGKREYVATLPDDKVYFARIIADSDGALPLRDKQGLQFPTVKRTEFLACSHEINAGLNAKRLHIHKVLECCAFTESQTFKAFVDYFFNEKIAAELAGNKIDRLFFKLLLNNAYGKFAQNPELFVDYTLNPSRNVDADRPWIESGWFGEKILYERPALVSSSNYWNVAIGASITSAARAYLFDALQHTTKPMYCDTDSIICESLDAPLHDTKLGAWKLEAAADELALIGKKMYAAFRKGKFIKGASKGIPTDPEFLRKLARRGIPATIELPAPSYRIGREPRFIKREVRIT